MDQSIRGAREELIRVLQVLDAPDGLERFYELVTEFAVRLGAETYYNLLNNLLDTCQDRTQILAAYAILVSNRQTLTSRRAVRVLENALARGVLDDRLLAACFLLYTSGITERAIPDLSRLADDTPKDDARQLWVAGAIFRAANPEGEYEELRVKAMWQLLDALRRANDPGRVLYAAIALRDEQVRVPQICSSLLDACQSADESTRLAIIGQLGKIGGVHPPVAAVLTALVSSPGEPTGIRMAAIQSLAFTPPDEPGIDDVLIRAMRDRNRDIFLQAASVLHRRRGAFPQAAVDLLLSYLSHSEAWFRGAAALCLADDPAGLRQAIPLLIQRVNVEEDNEIAETAVVALGKGGEAAFQPITDALESCTLHQLQRFQYALLEVSREDPARTARLMATGENRIGQAAAWVLGTLGPRASEAVPILHELLDSGQPERVQNALVALRTIGPAAAPCTESLARLLSHEVVDIRVWSEAVLVSIGPVIVPRLLALRNALPVSSHAARDRILASFPSLPARAASDTGVEGVKSKSDLELFGHVAALLTEHGPLSFRKLAEKLGVLQQAGKVRDGLPCSDGQIRLVVARLEEAWSQKAGQDVRLIDRSKTRKGGLTPDGHRYARLAREYLERLRESGEGS